MSIETVTVNRRDLYTLLLATASVREIDHSLKRVRQEALGMFGEAEIADAHDRMTRAYNLADRCPLPERMDASQVKKLVRFFGAVREAWSGMFITITAAEMLELRPLMADEWAEFGSPMVHWGSSQQTALVPGGKNLCRLTSRGVAEMRRWHEEEKGSCVTSDPTGGLFAP